MATASIRRVIRIGGSLALTLPPDWAKGKIVAGDEVAVISSKKELRIYPVQLEETDEVGRGKNK